MLSGKPNSRPAFFLPGITDFGGKTYGLPITSAKRYTTLLLYNVDYLQKAGYDPASEPLTWSTFREAAKKVTEQGNGAYYGFIIGGNQLPRWANAVRDLARMAGAVGGSGNQITSDINFLTGEYNFTTEEYIAAVRVAVGDARRRQRVPRYSESQRAAVQGLHATRGVGDDSARLLEHPDLGA